jgi:hypothetical protein
MINIDEYAPFFIKRTFNLLPYKAKKSKKNSIKHDYLFYEIYHKIYNIDNTSYKVYNELSEKILLSEKINTFKIKNKEYILNNLMYEPYINLITLNAIAKCYDINLVYVKDNIYIKMCHNINIPLLVITSDYNFIKKSLNEIENEYYEITNLEKPLNSVSYYKLSELTEIAIKLNLSYDKIKKVDLYNLIYNYLVKLNIFKID